MSLVSPIPLRLLRDLEEQMPLPEEFQVPEQDQLKQPTNPLPGRVRRSSTQGKLTEARAKAALEFGEIVKDTENPFYKSAYADLATLIKATAAPLARHGLTVEQWPFTEKGTAGVTTRISHSSDEWAEADFALPTSKSDAQGIGSAITYARRYAYQSILNIAGEEDDDGNAAVGKTQADRHSKSTENDGGTINPVQQRAFMSACKQGGRTDQQIALYLRTLGIEASSIDDVEKMPKAELNNAIKWAFNKNPDVQKELQKSVEAAKARTAKPKPTGITSSCFIHGEYPGEGNCPGCEA